MRHFSNKINHRRKCFERAAFDICLAMIIFLLIHGFLNTVFSYSLFHYEKSWIIQQDKNGKDARKDIERKSVKMNRGR